MKVDTSDFFAGVALLAVIQSRAVRKELTGMNGGRNGLATSLNDIQEEVDEAFLYADLMMEKAAAPVSKGSY